MHYFYIHVCIILYTCISLHSKQVMETDLWYTTTTTLENQDCYDNDMICFEVARECQEGSPGENSPLPSGVLPNDTSMLMFSRRSMIEQSNHQKKFLTLE